MSIKREFLLLGIVLVFVLLGLSGNAEATYPIVDIKCDGCSNKIVSGNNYIFYGDAEKTVNLVVSTTGGSGSVSYLWTSKGVNVCSSASCSVAVAGTSATYTLTAKDSAYGTFVKTVRLDPKSSQTGNCLPVWQGDGISMDDGGKNRKALAGGDTFTLTANFDESGCSGYQFRWETDNPDVAISKPDSTKTGVGVRVGARVGYTAVIRTVLSNSAGQRSEKNLTMSIVSNTPPTADIRIVGTPESYTAFSVDCGGSKSGNGYNEASDFIWKCTAVLKDSKGQVVMQNSQTAQNGVVPLLQLKPGESEFYTVVLTVEDLHGKTSSASTDIGVGLGDTGKDKPRIFAKIKPYPCFAGQECNIDATETKERNNRSVTLNFFIVSGNSAQQMVNSKTGQVCSGSVCTFVFNQNGNYNVRVDAWFSGEKDTTIVSQTLNVPVRQNISATANVRQPVQTPSARQSSPIGMVSQSTPTTSEPQYTPYMPSEETPKETPGPGIIVAIAAVILAFGTKRKQ